jgi:hypothetical protein
MCYLFYLPQWATLWVSWDYTVFKCQFTIIRSKGMQSKTLLQEWVLKFRSGLNQLPVNLDLPEILDQERRLRGSGTGDRKMVEWGMDTEINPSMHSFELDSSSWGVANQITHCLPMYVCMHLFNNFFFWDTISPGSPGWPWTLNLPPRLSGAEVTGVPHHTQCHCLFVERNLVNICLFLAEMLPEIS